MANVVFIRHDGSFDTYLFEVPANITLKEGEKVIVETKYGETDGVCACDSFTLCGDSLMAVMKVHSAYLPLKPVVGRVRVERFDDTNTTEEKPVADDDRVQTSNVVFSFTADEWVQFRNHVEASLPFIVQEECGELIQAISKMSRAILNGEELPKDNLLEEIADVFIAINLLRDYWDISNEEVTDWMNRKMERNIKRMEEAEKQ